MFFQATKHWGKKNVLGSLNNHVKSVFTTEDLNNIPNMGISSYPAVSDFEVTLQGVLNLLLNCNSKNSPGPDWL